MLPQRRPETVKTLEKRANRTKRWVSHAHCTFVRLHDCCVPKCTDRPIEAAHVRNGSDAGMGRKPSDWFTISLCQAHHDEQHLIGETSFAELHEIDMQALAAAFAKASPKAADIRRAQKERADV